MALAKVAATKLRRIDQGIAHARFTMGTIAARIDKQAAERAEYVLTLDDSVVAILKAGGVL